MLLTGGQNVTLKIVGVMMLVLPSGVLPTITSIGHSSRDPHCNLLKEL